jgi:hypothetical protein
VKTVGKRVSRYNLLAEKCLEYSESDLGEVVHSKRLFVWMVHEHRSHSPRGCTCMTLGLLLLGHSYFYIN